MSAAARTNKHMAAAHRAASSMQRPFPRQPEPNVYDPRIQAVAASYESAGKLPTFSLFAADVANVSTLKAVVKQVAYRNEIILLCGDGQATGSPNALNTALQFYAMRLRHVLFVSDTAESCERLRAGLPELACVWSSRVPRTKPDNGGGCVKRFWDMRFYFYDVRKHMVSMLAGELGMNVLQTDTDVAWFHNPYGVLKSGENGHANILAQWDAPYVNAGVFYVQGLRKGDGGSWVLSELHRRIALFMYHPEAVKVVVPWAVAPYFSNADEQTLMNDVLISAMTNTSCYIWSTAFFESRYGGAGKQRGWQGWQSTAESKLQPMLMRQCERSKLPGTGLYKLTEPSGGLHSTFKRGSSALFNHYLYLVKHMLPTAPAQQLHPFSNAIRAAVDVPAAAASAALEGRPVSYTTHAKMPGVMVHLAGIRTGAWSRRAIMRAHGWWHPEADRLVGAEMRWRQRSGALKLGGSSVVAAPARRELDVLVGNLLLLAVLLDRVAVVPETPCSFVPTPRSCIDGCAYDSVPTAPRAAGPPASHLRCAWLAPKRCWRAEWSTLLEFERATLRAAAATSGESRAAAQRRSRQRRLEEEAATEGTIPDSELPMGPTWPAGDEWRSVRQQRMGDRAAMGSGRVRRAAKASASGGSSSSKSIVRRERVEAMEGGVSVTLGSSKLLSGGRGAKLSGTPKLGAAGGKKGGAKAEAKAKVSAAAAEAAAAAAAAELADQAGEDPAPQVPVGASMEQRCAFDAQWLLHETFDTWSNSTQPHTSTQLSQRHAVAHLLRAVVCTAHKGGVAELQLPGRQDVKGQIQAARRAGRSGGKASGARGAKAGGGPLATSPALRLLMTEPLVRPRALPTALHENTPIAYRRRVAYYEQSVRSLLAKASRRVSATAQLERFANRTRATAIAASLAPYSHDIECIATLLAPPMTVAPSTTLSGKGSATKASQSTNKQAAARAPRS